MGWHRERKVLDKKNIKERTKQGKVSLYKVLRCMSGEYGPEQGPHLRGAVRVVRDVE